VWSYGPGAGETILTTKYWPRKYNRNTLGRTCATFERESLYAADCLGAKKKSLCEKRESDASAPDGDTCTAAAVGFETSIASRKGWEAYQKGIACKTKASKADKATRDTAVEAYLKAIKGATAVTADVANTLAAKKKAASEKATKKKALNADKKIVTEGKAAVKKAQGEFNAATTAFTTADNAHKAATGKKTKDDATLADLKAAAVAAHAAFGKGVKSWSDDIQL